MLGYRPVWIGSGVILTSVLAYRPVKTGSGVTVSRVIIVGLSAGQDWLWCDC